MALSMEAKKCWSLIGKALALPKSKSLALKWTWGEAGGGSRLVIQGSRGGRWQAPGWQGPSGHSNRSTPLLGCMHACSPRCWPAQQHSAAQCSAMQCTAVLCSSAAQRSSSPPATHQLRLRCAHGLSACLSDAVKGDEALAADVVHLACRLAVANHLGEGGGQVLDVAQLGDLMGGRGEVRK